MYGDNYGYRSGLNASMRSHLQSKAKRLFALYQLNQNSTILDIGSNDGTLLNALVTNNSPLLVGIDPTIPKFKEFYETSVHKIPEFFSATSFRQISEKADLITSISMLYDLQDPLNFVSEIESILSKNGVWHFEQSYLPSMMANLAYDTICHEHLEYYSLSSIAMLLKPFDLRVIDVEFNSVNGGSFAVTVTKKGNIHKVNPIVQWVLNNESRMSLQHLRSYLSFKERVYGHIDTVKSFFEMTYRNNFQVIGIGASTKGNVLLNASSVNRELMSAIAEVNDYKLNRVTPGSRIPIISEESFSSRQPDYGFVLPWHFKSSLNERFRKFTEAGGKLVYPLPNFEIVGD
jgi:hypothetical protein